MKTAGEVMTRAWVSLAVVSVLGLCGLSEWVAAEEQAQQTEQAGKVVQGINSADPSAHLNYASILFYKGRQEMASGDQGMSTETFKEMEAELLLALQLSESQPDGLERRLLRSQCAFLLGDLQLFIFKDSQKAKTFYQQAVEQFPDHQGAVAALKRLP
jgi:hypothetical protein